MLSLIIHCQSRKAMRKVRRRERIEEGAPGRGASERKIEEEKQGSPATVRGFYRGAGGGALAVSLSSEPRPLLHSFRALSTDVSVHFAAMARTPACTSSSSSSPSSSSSSSSSSCLFYFIFFHILFFFFQPNKECFSPASRHPCVPGSSLSISLISPPPRPSSPPQPLIPDPWPLKL